MAPKSLSEIATILEDLVRLPRLGVVAVQSDGRLLAYGLVGEAASLYSLDPFTGELRELTKPGVYSFAASRYNARRVIVARDVSRGAERVALYELDLARPGEEKPVEGLEPARLLGAADDGETAAFALASENEIALYAYRGGEAWRVAQLPRVSWVTDVRGDLVVGTVMAATDPNAMEIFVARVSSGEVKIYTPKQGATSLDPVITSKGVLFQSNYEDGEFRLYLLDPGSLEIRRYEPPGRDLEEYKPVEYSWYHEAPNGEILVIAKKEARSRIFLDGAEVKAPLGTFTTALLVADTVYATYSSLSKPTRIIEIDTVHGGIRELYAPREPEWMRRRLGRVTHTYVESVDGVKVPVLVLENPETGMPGPTAVLVHGGPFADYSDSFNIFAAALAGIGLHVVMPNYRGSTGYGEEYRRMIIGDPCGKELEDIVSAAKWARDKGIAKETIIMGYSYGGYMTLCALFRKPREFECGVAGASVVDWEEMYELSDAAFKQFIEVITAGKRELWRERSPITYAENLEKPLCMIQPQNDTRTPLKPVLRLMQKLQELGKTYEAHIEPDMGHAIYTVEDAEKVLLPALLFINRCLGAKSAEK